MPLLIGGPLIVIAALYGAFRAIGPGGEIEPGYELTDRAMKPLGLHLRLDGLHDLAFAQNLVIDLDTGDFLERLGQRLRIRIRASGSFPTAR